MGQDQGYGQQPQRGQGQPPDPWAVSRQGPPQWQDPRAPQPPYQPYGSPPGYQPQHATQPPRRPRKPHRGLRFLAWGSVAFLALIILAVVLSPKNSTPPASSSAPPAATGAKAGPSHSCKLKTTFDYIVRDSLPGAQIQASKIGNVDLSACADSLTTFRATAGQAAGECSTIALASSNKGYNVDAVPAPPLKGVIESAGPGC